MYFIRYPTASISKILRYRHSNFKTYTDIEALCFDIEGVSILILAGPARAGLQQLQAAVQLRWYSALIMDLIQGSCQRARSRKKKFLISGTPDRTSILLFTILLFFFVFYITHANMVCPCSRNLLSKIKSDQGHWHSTSQLEARGTKERAWLGWPFFGREIFILKTMMFGEVTTVLNERKHLKMVIRSVPDAIILILGRAEWPGLAALHRAQQVDLLCHRTRFKYWCH
jgi:hypothetical protein